MASLKHLTFLSIIAALIVGFSGCGKNEYIHLSNLNNHYAELRKVKDKYFKEDPDSPLLDEDKGSFSELNYYEPDLKYKFTGQIQKYEKQEVVEMLTSTSDLRNFHKYGYFSFEIDGNEYSVQLYKEVDENPSGESYYFVPFKDLTNETDTYAAGRYLDIPSSESDIITIDFNEAYNPYCTYSPFYSCPLPPIENHLKVAIKAGEKNFKTDEAKG